MLCKGLKFEISKFAVSDACPRRSMSVFLLPMQELHPLTHQGLPSAVRWSHILLESHLRAGDLAVDATAGNGHDTLFLSHLVGPKGHVFALDVQAAALESTRRRLEDHGIQLNRHSLIQAGHESLLQSIPCSFHGRIKGIMFNLGWLPGSDKGIITRAETTLPALDAALHLLAPGGLLTLAVYPGHEGGREERQVIGQWADQLPIRSFEVQQIRPINPAAHPPECWVFWKRKV
ncbi:MAG TPA: rRNA methyltransferase [Verrucomicrobiales bacterium]|nr:rRNA methyltransferase [Verrucomicrobiales bacterium]